MLAGRESPLRGWERTYGHAPVRAELGQIPQVWAWVEPVALTWGTVALGAFAAGLVVALRRGLPAGRNLAIAILVGGLLGSGLQSTWGWIAGTTEPSIAAEQAAISPRSPDAVSGDQVVAARWIRDRSGPNDVIATNRWCRDAYRGADGSVQLCAATAFWVPAYTERRTLVAGWAYTGPALDAGARAATHYTRQPFWDPGLLTLQESAFTEPTPAGIAALYEHGVRFLLADLRAGPVDLTGVDAVAERELTTPDAVVWSIR